jgi:hypothetical protein
MSNKLASELLQLKTQIAPTLDRIEQLEDKLRASGKATYDFGDKGSIKVSAAGVPTLKGTGLKFHEEEFNRLSLKEKTKLQALKVVELVSLYSRAVAAKVTVTLPAVAAKSNVVKLAKAA